MNRFVICNKESTDLKKNVAVQIIKEKRVPISIYCYNQNEPIKCVSKFSISYKFSYMIAKFAYVSPR